MLNAFRSENLKYRRSFARSLVLFAPLFFILMIIPQKMLALSQAMTPWRVLLAQAYNWWPVLFVPLGTALMVALVQAQEVKAGRYRGVRSHAVNPMILWAAKIGGAAFNLLLATMVLILVTLIRGLITAGGEVPWREILEGGLTIWLVSLILIPIQLLAAAWKGMAFSIVLGFVGMIAGVVAAPGAYWIYVPWSWGLRLMCPLIGVHPNGVLLEPGDTLLDPGVIPLGIGVSLIAFVIVSGLTAFWFKQQEVR